MKTISNDDVIKALEKDRLSDKKKTILNDKFLDESIVATGIVTIRGKSKPK